MFDPMTLLAAPFARGDLPAPGPEAPMAVLRARPPSAPVFAPGDLKCEQGMRPLHDALAQAGFDVTPRLDAPEGAFAAAAVALTRAKAENRANFARAWRMTRPGGAVLAAGAKTDGVESLQKDLRRVIALDGAIPRDHGRVIWARRTADTPPEFDRWIAEAAPAIRVEGRFRTVAGAFSWTEADPGSQLLAQNLPPLSGKVADLGAGWGWLADAALRRGAPEAVDLFEADAAALDCARRNVADPRARFFWADAAGPEIPRGEYDWVISNPPFHEGRAVSIALGHGFLEAAARMLAPGGTFMLVANRSLPYERRLNELFGQVEQLALTPRYKVLSARRPRRRRA
ncbi:class I SAM-dependent methyltransferase [Oceanicella actignis]|uniref:16S rRNA (Guanine1207-N2)-methyltransferase n=1 Tax=Oceanicella actignis TaxID=1189325 RepID=A0A1M7TS84_9RHOB|nr:class I SAM-dependent methyltransferase [Oceanicella actignis]SET76990.1 16S rRNA m(2)G 1207 methyltransferase [Oceanicella actignis]SHN73591.1 16S rRNA (guanine1207-N2)-methyltransferase [Oceanicella actignis]